MAPLTPLSSSQLGTGFSDEELEGHHQTLQVSPPPPPPPCVPGALALREARGTGPALRSWHCGAGFRVVQHVQVPVPALPATGQSLRAQCLGRAETGSGRACCSFPEFALRMPVEPLVIAVFAVLVPGIWGVLWLSCVLVSLVLSVPFLFPPPL